MVDSAITGRPDSVTRILGLDHRRLDAILADAKRCLSAGDLRRAAARFREFRDGLERHIAAEEEILFPAFEAFTGTSGGGPTHVMRLEHAELRRLLAEVASNLEHGGGEGHTTPLAALTARIYAHNGREERILYPATDRAAPTAAELEQLVRRVQASLAPRSAEAEAGEPGFSRTRARPSPGRGAAGSRSG